MYYNSFSAHGSNISCHEGMVCFAVLSLKSDEIYMKAFKCKGKFVKIMAPEGRVGQKGIKCLSNIWKNISTWAKVTQVSDVAHEPLVLK
jgi:hypothetical protein